MLIRALADWIAGPTPPLAKRLVPSRRRDPGSIVADPRRHGPGVFRFSTIQIQFVALLETLPSAWTALRSTVEAMPGGEYMVGAMENASPADSGFFANAGTIALALGGALVNLLLVVFGAVFLAGNPHLYRTGVLKLVPERRRLLADEAMTGQRPRSQRAAWCAVLDGGRPASPPLTRPRPCWLLAFFPRPLRGSGSRPGWADALP